MRSPARPATRAGQLLLAPEWMMLPDGPAQDLGVVVRRPLRRRRPAGRRCARASAPTPIALPQRLLMPGFVDAHHHLTQCFGKALAFGEPSEIFRRIWVPLESSSMREACT